MEIAGNWKMILHTPMGVQRAVLKLNEDNGTLTGTVTHTERKITAEIYDGKVNGDKLTWKSTMKLMPVTLTFNVTVEGDKMNGKVKTTMLGEFEVVGERE